jgi:hypothetical protein
MALQATNAGIDYQQRISAYFMTCLLMDHSLNHILSTNDHSKIKSIQLEGSDYIDDLIITTESNAKLFFQVKRKLSFSNRLDGELYGVVEQFVRQHFSDHYRGKYVLVTTSSSSDKITQRMRRLLNAIRSAGDNTYRSTLTKLDLVLLQELEVMISKATESAYGIILDSAQLHEIMSQMYVDLIDIQSGEQLEKIIFQQLVSYVNVDSELFFGHLISAALTFASNRQSISKGYLEELLGSYLLKHSSPFEKPDIHYDVDFAVDRDVLICRSQELCDIFTIQNNALEKEVLFILELFRFESDGSKRMKYEFPNHAIMSSGVNLEILHRAATNTGSIRWLEEHLDPEQYELVIVEADEEHKSVGDKTNKLHYDWMKQSFNHHIADFLCLNCGEKILTEEAVILEIDCERTSPKVGGCHTGCINPTDRVLGRFQMPEFKSNEHIENFDYGRWIDALKRSCSVFASMDFNRPATILWTRDYNKNNKNDYAVRFNLENGDFVISLKRGKVERFSKEKLELRIKEMNQLIEDGLAKNNPFCYTPDLSKFGNYEYLKANISMNEELIACKSVEAVKYNSSYSEMFDLGENYYAPLVYFMKDDEFLVYEGLILMISDITKYAYYRDNWAKLGLNLEGFNAITVYNDEEFDKLALQVLDTPHVLAVDPRFGRNLELISGAIIGDMRTFLDQAQKRNGSH